jgi:hypothetical protein
MRIRLAAIFLSIARSSAGTSTQQHVLLKVVHQSAIEPAVFWAYAMGHSIVDDVLCMFCRSATSARPPCCLCRLLALAGRIG